MPNSISVQITADVAGLTTQLAVANAGLRATQKELTDLARTATTAGVGNVMTKEMLAAGDASAAAAAKVRLYKRELASLATERAEVQGIGTALNSVAGASQAKLLEKGAEGIGVFGGALSALGPAGLVASASIAALSVAMDKAREAVDAGAEIQHLSNTLGVTTDFVQRFNFALRQNEIDVAAGDNSLQKLNISLGLVQSGLARTQQIRAFEAVGFTPDQLRQFHDAGELFPILAQRIANVGNVAEQSAIARRVGIEALLPMLRKGADGFNELSATADRLNIVVGRDQVAALAEAKEKLAQLDQQMQAGEIKSFAQFSGVLVTAKQAWLNFETNGLAALENIRESIIAVMHPLAALKAELGRAMNTFNPGSGNGLIMDANRTLSPLIDGPKAPPTAAPSAKDVAAKQLVDPAGGKGRKGGNDEVEEWREQLQQMEVASGDFFKNNDAMEAAFWQGKLALTKTGSKQWLAVQSEIYGAQKTLAHQAFDEHMADLSAQAEADKDNWTKYRADLQAEADFVKSKQGEESTAYKDKMREIAAAELENQHKIEKAQEAASQRAVAALRESLDAQQSIRESAAAAQRAALAEQAKGGNPLGGVNAAKAEMALDSQLAQQKIANEQAVKTATLAADQQAVELKAALYGLDSQQYADANKKKLDDEQQFQDKIREMQAQMVSQQIQDQIKIREAWNSAITPMVDSFGTGIKGMIEGTENLHTALRGMADTILGVVIQAIERWVAAQIVAAITGTTVSASSAKTQVLAAAGLAGANGVASFAAAPFPIDLGAPAFGASMVASALSLGAFDQGTNRVPADMIAMIHEGERIIPKADNSAMMSAIAGGGAGGGGGTTNLNVSHSSTYNGPPSFKDFINQHQRDMIGWMKSMHRNGMFRT